MMFVIAWFAWREVLLCDLATEKFHSVMIPPLYFYKKR